MRQWRRRERRRLGERVHKAVERGRSLGAGSGVGGSTPTHAGSIHWRLCLKRLHLYPRAHPAVTGQATPALPAATAALAFSRHSPSHWPRRPPLPCQLHILFPTCPLPRLVVAPLLPGSLVVSAHTKCVVGSFQPHPLPLMRPQMMLTLRVVQGGGFHPIVATSEYGQPLHNRANASRDIWEREVARAGPRRGREVPSAGPALWPTPQRRRRGN